MAHVTVPATEAAFDIAVGSTPSTGPFTVPASFILFDQADLRIRVGDTELTQSQFTFSGTYDGGYAGGSITLAVAVSDTTIHGWREVVRGRAADFPEGAPVSRSVLNTEFDRIAAQIVDARARDERALRAPDYAAAVDMSSFYGRGLYFDDDGIPTPSDVLTPTESYANGTWMTGRNAADSADLNMWRINSANVLEPGTVISYDNTGQHIDRAPAYMQAQWTKLSPTTLHTFTYTIIQGNGDNTGFKGVCGHYLVVADDPSVNTNAERGVLYGYAVSVRPRVDRSNAPSDDVAGYVVQNDGAGKATELIYVGRGANALASEANAAIGIDMWGDSAIFAMGHYANGIDFSRASASPAQFTGAAVRVPNNVTVLSGRDAANSADVALLGINASDQLTLRGLSSVTPSEWTPTVTAASGTGQSGFAGVVGKCRYMRLFGRCWVDVEVTTGTVGTSSGALRVTLPFTAAADATWTGRDTAGGASLHGLVASGSNILSIYSPNSANAPFSDGNYYRLSGSFEV